MNELNRDLFVAVLAVLTDTVPQEGLAAILDSWSQRRQTPLVQLLKRLVASMMPSFTSSRLWPPFI